MTRILLAFLYLLPFSTGGFAQGTVATATLDTNIISIGEQTKVNLNIEFHAGEQVIFPQFQDSLASHIAIVEKSKIDTSFHEKDVKIKILSQELTITSFDSGFHPIPPILFFVNGDSLGTEPMLLTVKTIPIPDNADIKDIKDVLDVPFSFWDWVLLHKWYILAALAFILVITLGIYFYRRYKARPQKEMKVEKPLVPAHITALRKLEELKDKKLWQNSKVKEFHSEISYIMREYLENRYDTNSLDNTTDEIIAEMRALEIPEADRKKMAQVLSLADMAKFAKQQPVSFENEESMKNAEAFVHSTQQVDDEKISKDLNESERR